MLGRNVLSQLAEVAAAAFNAIRKGVSQRHDTDILMLEGGTFLDVFGVVTGLGVNHIRLRAQRVKHSAAAASTTADQADANRIVRGGMAREHKRKVADGCCAGRGKRRVFQE
jgi:hypothetical protein